MEKGILLNRNPLAINNTYMFTKKNSAWAVIARTERIESLRSHDHDIAGLKPG